MASLTHVRMFCEHGWKKITALEAAAKFPERVQAKSGIFMCDQDILVTQRMTISLVRNVLM